jgi:serine/threonine protein kinase
MTHEAPLPEKIGRYPVERLLGRGAMGSVYLARDTDLERAVAIKTVRLPTHPDEAENFLVRFRNEARAVGRLRHRSIIAVYDVGNDPVHGPYLVFEYVEGANLKDVLKSKGPLTGEQLVALADQVGGALDAAHREGIIHRDIKPENLLVGRDGVVRLADFGVARVPDAALTGEGQFLGTPCYGAPETLRSGVAGPRSDQFSLAAVLYEAASGVRAFPGTDAMAVAHAVIHDQPPPPSRVAAAHVPISPALDAVIMRALSKDPAQRFEQLSVLVSELRRALGFGSTPQGEIADTLPALGARISLSTNPPPAPVKRALPLWPFGLALVLGVVAVVQLAPKAPAEEPEPGSDAQLTGTADPEVRANRPVPLADVVVPPVVPDAAPALQDAGSAAIDPSGLSAFEREERAKDALERAERALGGGDKEAARQALDEAFALDPEHPDIAALRRKL